LETSVNTRLYEGMFLVDSAEAAADWDGINAAVRGVLEKAGAEIVSMRKWDERKLAYEINHKERGTYILTYFKVEPGKIGQIEGDVQLSERIMRVLVLRADKFVRDDIEKETPFERQQRRRREAEEAAAKARAEKSSAEAGEAAAEPSEQPAVATVEADSEQPEQDASPEPAEQAPAETAEQQSQGE